MAITQHVKPRTNVLDGPGWCLRHTQSVYGLTGAPFWHASAWKAWEATEHKHKSRTMPNASVPVWFSHYGTYGAPARYDNWGHVVSYVPGRGFLSSPAWVRPGQTVGQQWFDSIEAVERTFNAKFVGWSEDLNGTRIISGAGGSGSGSTGGLTVSEYKKLDAKLDKIYDHITFQFNVTRGSSWLGWVKSNLWKLVHRNPTVNVDIDAAELATEIREAFGDELAADVVNELSKRLSEK